MRLLRNRLWLIKNTADGLRCSNNYLDRLIKNANCTLCQQETLKSGRNNVNVRGLRLGTAVNWIYKRCFIRHITCKMKWKWYQTFSKDSVPSEIQWYKNTRASFWFLNVHYVLVFIQQSLLEKFWYSGGSPQINVCMWNTSHNTTTWAQLQSTRHFNCVCSRRH